MQPLPLFGARQRTQTGIMAQVSNNVNVASIMQIHLWWASLFSGIFKYY